MRGVLGRDLGRVGAGLEQRPRRRLVGEQGGRRAAEQVLAVEGHAPILPDGYAGWVSRRRSASSNSSRVANRAATDADTATAPSSMYITTTW